MRLRQIAIVAAAAVLMFWIVGAYNRMVALRNVIGQAWSKVDEALRQRALACAPLIGALRDPLAAEQGALDTLQAAHAAAVRQAATMGQRPVVAAHAADWVSAESALAAAASRVFALIEYQAGLREQAEVAAGVAVWREAELRLAFARQLFNEAADAYNGAIAIFPTRLLLRPFGFGPAGRI
jgi:LemA protein